MILALVLSFFAPAQQATAVANEARAQEVLAAHLGGDEVELRRLGAERSPDAYQVAKRLLWIHLDEPGAGALEAAGAFADVAGSCLPVWEALPQLVDDWGEYTPADLERERRLRDRLLRMRAVGESNWGEVLRIADEAAADLAQRNSITACELVYVRAASLWSFARHEEAAREFLHAAALGEELGWKAMQAQALQHAAHQHHTRRARADAAAAYERELAVREVLGESVRSAQVRVILGGLLADLERLDEAEVHLERAADEMRVIGDSFGVGTANQRLARISGLRSRFAEAIEREDRALAAFEQAQHREGAARALANIGTYARQLGDFALAHDHLERAVAELEVVGDGRDAGRALQDLGLLWRSLGETARALESFERARAKSAAAGDARAAANTLTLIADCQCRLGRYSEALRSCELALSEHAELDYPRGEAQALAALGSTARALQWREQALEHYVRALEVQEELGDRGAAAETLVVIGDVLSELGRADEALAAYERASETLAALGMRARAASARSRKAGALQVLGHPAEALEMARAAREELDGLGARWDAALSLRREAELLAEQGQLEPALEAHLRVLRESRTLGNEVLALDSLTSAGRVRQRLGMDRDALADVRSAAQLRARLTSGLAEEEALGLRAREVRDVHLGTACIARLLEDAPADADELRAEAFRLSEVGRARLLAEGLALREALLEARLPAELFALESEARHRVRELQQRVARVGSSPEPELEEVAGLAAELDSAYDELQATRARVQREVRHAAELVRIDPVSVDELRARLGANEVYVAYEVSPDRLRALVATRESLELFDLGAVGSLDARIALFLQLSGTPHSDDRVPASELYDALLRPLSSALAGCRRLLVSPDGPLTFLPFDALLDRESDARAVERWEIVLTPSASVHVSLAERARSGGTPDLLLALGDPIYPREARAGADPAVARGVVLRGLTDLPRLPGTGAEVASIAALFDRERQLTLTRERASLGGLLEHLDFLGGGAGILHLACHGHLDRVRPRLSGLVLAGGEVLSVAEVYGLELDADLVVLSACDSGRGELIRGEGAIGLVRGFLFAGSSRVIVSNWKVNDDSASSLMLDFYRRMRTGAMAPGRALREAKLEHLSIEGSRGHPHHWAGFVLWGLP